MRHSADGIWLSCGQYLISIQGSDVQSGFFWLRKEYQPISETRCPDVVLRLEEGLDTVKEKPAGAWHVFSRDDYSEVVYFQNSRPHFSLQYGRSLSEVTVRVDKMLDGYTCIGIQYGMMLALHQKCIGFHGVTLLCEDEILILSAPSGTGKTTLAHLLETYCNAIVINGDFALLSPTEDGVIFEPTPFCGTSRRCLNHRVQVNRVVFLSQATTNEWRELTGREAVTHFMSNAFVPAWDSQMQQTLQQNIMKCVSMLRMNAFAFVPTREAAEMFCKQLRAYEDSSS